MSFHDAEAAGAALDPAPFPVLECDDARRVKQVTVCDQNTGRRFLAQNVLIRVDHRDHSLRNAEVAYLKIPNKENIVTRKGHIEHCHVLKRMSKADDEVVFVLSDEIVSIKVSNVPHGELGANHPPDYSRENAVHEAVVLRMVGPAHPHVIGSLETLYDGERLYCVLPYCDGGDLYDLAGGAGGLPEPEARRLFCDLLLGEQHLQHLGLCHRDLSPENVMIKAGYGAIIDLGMCLRVPHSAHEGIGTRRLINPQGQLGKLPYMSPEIYRNADAFDGYAVDMWGWGIILFYLLTGLSYKEPYDPVFNAMTRDMAGLLPHWGIHLSPEAVELLQQLITIDPRDRLTLDEALAHPWLQL